MTSQSPDLRLPHVPWGAVVGEFTTAACFGCLGLFLPLYDWVSWPELVFSWHLATAVIGTLALALALVRRKPEAIKVAIVLAAYIGLPSLLNLPQAVDQLRSAADSSAAALSCVAWGIGMLGQAAQVAVVFSCLGRLVPAKVLESSASPSVGVVTNQRRQETVVEVEK